ncbi:helix-turn-helix domain-containing protein [Nocardia spumae]|uniref:helix-turn-helix domain-containing protein n=1 Tax=Nocardia spumae TaxID=2887190 RepID=UPI001D15DDE3|nr:helix-turn-helix transcriptional regulator [Nocardia spumae]
MAEYPRLHSLPGGRDGASASHDSAEARPRADFVRSVPAPPRRSARTSAEPLWREVLGERLRELRRDQGETLSETAGRAGISPQYLSEIERGRKEPSSEMIAALAGALGTTLGELTTEIAGTLRRVSRPVPVGPLVGRPPVNPTMLARAA